MENPHTFLDSFMSNKDDLRPKERSLEKNKQILVQNVCKYWYVNINGNLWKVKIRNIKKDKA